MAKRFTNSDKWRRPDFRKLEPELKLLYLYIFENCEHTGTWEEDIDMANFQTGLNLNRDQVRQALDGLLIITSHRGRVRYFLPDFIEDQYGETFNHHNKVHASVVDKLERFGILYTEGEPFTFTCEILQGLPKTAEDFGRLPKTAEDCQTPPSSYHGAKEIEKEKEKEIEKENNKKESKKTKSEHHQLVDRFATFWSSDMGVPGAPLNFSAADGAAAKKLLAYLSDLEAVKEGRKTPMEVWDYILDHWHQLEPFYQKQIKLPQIVGNMPNIIRQLNPKNKPQHGKQNQPSDISQLADNIRKARTATAS